MQLFEITLLLLAVAVVFLQIARRLRVPYPSLLALAGGCVAVLPFAPHLNIEPRLVLALFVAPAVMDTAFDLPPREMLRNWLPLVSLAVLLVLVTTAAVAWAGVVACGIAIGGSHRPRRHRRTARCRRRIGRAARVQFAPPHDGSLTGREFAE